MSKVAVLGPAGTFSAKAAKIMYPDSELHYVDDVEDVFRYVAEGRGFGVAAVENSLEGSVGATLESLLSYDVKIVGSITLNIDLYLMAKAGAKKDVKTIRSHSHALAQCKTYLKRNYPKARTEATSSTTEAMKQASKKGGNAAVGNIEAGKAYGLKVLDEHIQDEDSVTKFISVSNKAATGTKTSIIFAVQDEPGALYGIIGEFAKRGLNLKKIESRPSRKKLGEYIFYVDYENNGMRAHDLEAFHQKLGKRTTFLKDLGSY